MGKRKLTIVIIVLLLLLAGAGGFVFGRISAGKSEQDTQIESGAEADTEKPDITKSDTGSSEDTADPSVTEPAEDITVTSVAEADRIPAVTSGAEPAEATQITPVSEPVETEAPTTGLAAVPTDVPAVDLTAVPTNTPTKAPTAAPTNTPTKAPTAAPTNTPTKAPTAAPTNTPTKAPTAAPTNTPTKAPVKAESGTPYENHGQLSVKGTKLVDKNGEGYILRGVSTHGIAWFPDYVNKAAFKTLRDDWGANCIRLAMYTAEYNGYCSGGNKSDLKKLVGNGVQYATELGMYVIIDWHILSDSNPQNNKDEALKFFKEMSEKYSDHGNVIYEICNEPNGGTSWSQIKSYAEEVIPVIRKNAPDAIIVVGTPTWSQEVDKAAADPVKGYDNIMYTIHFYAATHKDDLRKRMQNAVKSGIALFCTEFGTCDASGSGGNDFTESQKWIDAMESAGISYCIWNLSNKSETSAQISSSCSKTSGWKESELSASGKWYRNLLRSLTSVKLTDGAAGAGEDNSGTGTGNGGNDKTGTGNGENDKTGNGGNDNSGTGTGNGENDNSGNGENGGNSGSSDGNKSENSGTPDTLTPAEAKKGNISVRLTHTGGWSDGSKTFYQFTVTLQNTGNSEISGWKVIAGLGIGFELSQSWNGVYEVKGNDLTIGPVDYNSSIAAGREVEVGFIVSCEKEIKSISIKIE